MPPSPELQRAQIDAALKRASVGTTREALEADERNLGEARVLADALGDEPRLASVLYWLGRLAYVRGMFDSATDYAEQSLAIADRLDDEALAGPPVNLMGRRYYLTGEYARAGRLLARSVEQMRNLGNPTEEATAAGFAGVAFGALGEFERALAHADHGLHLSQQLKNPFVEAAAYNYRAVAHCHQGSAAAAIADCEEARRLAESVGDRFRIYLVQFYEGHAYTMAGDPAKARELLEASIALAKELGTTTLLAWGQGLLARTLLAQGDAEAAEPLCRQAIRLAERTHDRLANALAHRVLARALAILEPGSTTAAETAVLEAMRIQREMGCEPELGRSHLAYALLLDGWSRAEEARRNSGTLSKSSAGSACPPIWRAPKRRSHPTPVEETVGNFAVNGRIGIVLSGWAPAMTLMSGAMLGFMEKGVQFDVISTTGVGALIGLLSLAPKTGAPKQALEELPNMFVSDLLYSVLPINFKLFHKFGPFSKPMHNLRNRIPKIKLDPKASSPVGRLLNDWVDLAFCAMTPSTFELKSQGNDEPQSRDRRSGRFHQTEGRQGLKPKFYLNAFNLDQRILEIFDKASTTADAYHATEAMPVLFAPQRMASGDLCTTGATHDPTGLQAIWLKHKDDLDAVVMLDPMSRAIWRSPVEHP